VAYVRAGIALEGATISSQMKLPHTKFYVVTAPPSIRGIYESWARCDAAVLPPVPGR